MVTHGTLTSAHGVPQGGITDKGSEPVRSAADAIYRDLNHLVRGLQIALGPLRSFINARRRSDNMGCAWHACCTSFQEAPHR